MRRIAFTAIIVLVFGLTLSLTASPAAACSCFESSDEEALEWSDAVFAGRVLEIREDADTFVWLVEVESIVKGDPERYTTLETPHSSASCGTTFPLDTLGIFFVNDNNVFPSAEYKTGLCSPSRATTAPDQVLPDLERRLPQEGDRSVLTAFEIGVVVDAPDAIEETPVVPEEELTTGGGDAEGAVELSAQDQAELAAAEPTATTAGGTNRTAVIIVAALVAFAALVFVLELRRGRRTA